MWNLTFLSYTMQKKIDENGCNGASDWVIEIVSPGSRYMDYGIKVFKYCTAGVREYWIVDAENAESQYMILQRILWTNMRFPIQ